LRDEIVAAHLRFSPPPSTARRCTALAAVRGAVVA
jgi:hypothetical protein